jgi:hypothetical protein
VSFNKLYFPICLVLVAFLWLSACGAEKISKTEIGTVQPTVETVITPTFPTPTALPTATSQAILPIIGGTLITTAQENRLVKTLQLEECELPCYLGITPGKTSWASAQQILADLGAEYVGEDYEGGTGMRGYAYKILVSDTASSPVATLIAINPRYPLDIGHFLSFVIGGDSVVQRITVDVSGAGVEVS